ncbi:MAG: hypothetical protein II516_12580, partial [Treponema sp.]|nr:hypothetical protein [Treponema sp.]
MDDLLIALPFCSLANPTVNAPAPPPFRPSLTLIPPSGRYCRGSMAAYDLEKSLHGFSQVLQNRMRFCMLLSRPSMGFL